MNRARDEFFAGAGFPGDQNGRTRRRDLFDERVDLANRVGVADELAKRATVLQFAAESFVFLPCEAELDSAVDCDS